MGFTDFALECKELSTLSFLTLSVLNYQCFCDEVVNSSRDWSLLSESASIVKLNLPDPFV